MKPTIKNLYFIILLGFASGLYPMLYNYYSNFTLVNSSGQFFYFLIVFLGLPIVSNLVIWVAAKNIAIVSKFYGPILTMSNLSWFSYLIILSAFGLQRKIMVVAFIVAAIIALLLFKHLKKIMILELLMAIVVGVQLPFFVINHVNFSTEWQKLPDTITDATFTKKPNIYLIQPDGYANTSQLSKPPYNYDNSNFEDFLKTQGFKLYENFRSNYTNTVTSNAALFSMKHHYYKIPTPKNVEPEGLRTSITSENAVLKTLKKNGYQTSLLLEIPYLIINRPDIAYDYNSIDYAGLDYLSRGFDMEIDIFEDTKQQMAANPSVPNFYFIEKMDPRHIAVLPSQSKGVEKEREQYIENLDNVNVWLTKTISHITKKDPKGLIIILADHGGYVGLESTSQRRAKVTDTALVDSMFSTFLAIKWPNGNAPDFDNALKTNTNLFRILFTYLSENKKYLNHLENDGSYLILTENAPFGVYKALDDDGTLIYELK